MEKIKIGVFGLWRGMSYLEQFHRMEDAVIWAVCDKNREYVEKARKLVGDQLICCGTYEELLDSGIDAVVLCNYFPEHAARAIQAVEHGVDVMSECTAAPTLKMCAELCEAVERTGRKYYLAENYPFTTPFREMTRLCREGTLGDILYAEGEYNHNEPAEVLKMLTPGKYHWRAWLPRSYYVTHALGPLMYATGQMPVRVSAMAVHSKVQERELSEFRHNTDALAMMNCLTDKGALFRATGCTAMASPSGYRIVGENGSCETGRTLGDKVSLWYQKWLTPEGRSSNQIYVPNLENFSDRGGHGGGDYMVADIFMRYLRDGEEPFFNVYRGCAMSAVGILGWRSCLEDGKPYDIPDFQDPAQRDAVRGDDLTPFPDENGNGITLPCNLAER